MRVGTVAAVVLLAALAVAPASAQQPPPQGNAPAAVMLVLDASKSMNDDDGSGRPKLEAAKAAMNTLIDSLPDDARVGLRVYGSEVSGGGKAAGCADTRLVTPVGPLNRGALKDSVAQIQSKGFTPIGASLRAAASDLPAQGANTIVLVSDGGDNCAPPSPCSVAQELAGRGVNLQIQAVGFQVKQGARRQLQCIADKGKGSYVDADNAQQLGQSLKTITARALRGYKTRGSRLDAATAPNLARPVGAGQYVSSVPAGQTRWYAFRIGQGQGLRVNVTVPNNAPGGRPQQLQVEMKDETLDYVDSDAVSEYSGSLLSATAVNAEVKEDQLRNPPTGVQYVSVRVSGSSGDVPIEVLALASGAAPAPAKTKPLAAPVTAVDTGDVSDLVLIVAAAVALALGAFGGIALGRAVGRRA
jgi:Ca-activated chloride channel family protein